MAHQVKVKDGHVGFVALPDGNTYEAGAIVTLTDVQFAQLSPASIDGDPLIDMGEVGDVVTSGSVFIDLTGTPITGDVTDWDPGALGDAVVLVTNQATGTTHPYPVWEPDTVLNSGIYVPTVLNGHGYQVASGGTTGPTEPAWVTDATSFAEGPDSLVWQDLGAGSDTQPVPNVIHGIVAATPNQALTVLCSLDSIGGLAWDVNKENPNGGWQIQPGHGIEHMRVLGRWWVKTYIGWEDPAVD